MAGRLQFGYWPVSHTQTRDFHSLDDIQFPGNNNPATKKLRKKFPIPLAQRAVPAGKQQPTHTGASP
jgi:hypothetical protein